MRGVCLRFVACLAETRSLQTGSDENSLNPCAQYTSPDPPGYIYLPYYIQGRMKSGEEEVKVR